ncbi:TonB-dependent receptor [Luteimonas sp. RD2P54]|uniref:TonB-dependent receptor n=1 Tax=Luteimonas endophytica TaxID=3042023 RepID=A0ABT6J939_9GAMM|nr:TonB-dependent receptor [Luteimonas endophytica]MDH5823321.1 TonB-dependent receptor [Luteimonas endophytica]
MNGNGEKGRQGGVPQRSALFAATAAALAWMAAAPAFAQEAVPQPESQPERQPAADAVDLDVVVVTANKRVENIRTVGSSISLIGEQQLENLNAARMSDYADYVPGLQVQDNGAPGLTSVSMRGISALSSGATVGTYVDEVPLGSSGLYQAATTLALDLLPYDIGRIEVLRGPQGTLYGAGAMGGLIKYVTREPDTAAREFRVGGGLSTVSGGGNGWSGRAGANLPLSDDRMALRVSYGRHEGAGYTDSAIDGEQDINDSVQTSARAAFGWYGDAFTMRVSALRQTIDADDRAEVALDPDTYQPLFGELDGRLWVRQPFSKEFDLYALTLDWDLGWADFVSASGWSDTTTDIQLDATIPYGEVANLLLGLPEAGASTVVNELELDKFTQEFRLTSKAGGPFEWMVGAFYTKEDGVQRQFASLSQLDGSPLPPPLDAVAGTLAVIHLPSEYEEMALFANGSWRVTDRLTLDAGVRQARNDQQFVQDVTEGILAPIERTPGESSEDVFTWSLSPKFQLADDVMLYAKAATGYQPGGPNAVFGNAPPSVDSSMLTSYELGLKSQFADQRLLFDLVAFRIDWEDIQVVTQIDGLGVLVNGGEATSEGVELSTVFRATDSLRLGLNAAWTDASLKEDFQPTTVQTPDFDVVLNSGLAGDRMPYVPEWSWSATAEYAFALGAGWQGLVGGALRHVGDRVGGTSDRERIVLPGDPSTILDETVTAPLDVDGYQALDLYASVTNGSWNIRAYVNNATDERGYSSISRLESALSGTVAQLNAVPIRPRTYGLEFDYRF